MRCLLLLLAFAALRAESVVFLGDSLTAGHGVDPDQAYPALVGAALAADPATARWRVVDAGVSGDTSAGGLGRVAWVLKGRPELVVVALGGNDGLRGLPLDGLERNLRAIVARIRAGGARAALAGMRMPANLGPDYTAGFAALYPRIAKDLDLPLLPFLLDGVALDPRYNQADLVHPNAEGHQVIARRVTAWLKPLLAAKP